MLSPDNDQKKSALLCISVIMSSELQNCLNSHWTNPIIDSSLLWPTMRIHFNIYHGYHVTTRLRLITVKGIWICIILSCIFLHWICIQIA